MRVKPLLVSASLLIAVGIAESVLAQPFTMRIVDEFGDGVANVRVVTDNGIVCYSLLDGTLRWAESSLMSRSVRFSIHDDTHTFAGTVATIAVKRGAGVVVPLDRIQPAS